MNLNSELFLGRNYITRKKPKKTFEGFSTEQKLSYFNPNPIKNRLFQRNKDYFLEKIKSMKNDTIVNNIFTPSEKSYLTENNQSQINTDIYGYNNYIINKNNYNTINFTSKKNTNQKTSSISNFTYTDTPHYLTEYESNSNFKKPNYEINPYLSNTSNKSKKSFNNNNDIRFMNMKLNFQILQQKLTHLNDIAISNTKDSFKTPYKMPFYSNTNSEYDNNFVNNKYPIKVFRSEKIKYNNKSRQFLKVKKRNEGIIQKMKEKKEMAKNYKIMNNDIFQQTANNFHLKMKNENELFRIKIRNKKESDLIKDRYYTNNNSLKKQTKKEESDLSQIADNILEINKSLASFDNNYYLKDKSLDIFSSQQKKKNINIKNKHQKNKHKYILNESEDIPLNKEINKTQNINEQKNKLMVEHIFSYDSTDHKKTISEVNSDKIKIKNNNNKNINIVQTNNFIINNVTKPKNNNKEEREERVKIENKSGKNEDIILKKEKLDNFKINEKSYEEEDEDNNDGDNEDDGDKIINSLIATASQNLKNEKKNENNNIQISDFENHLKKSKEKNVTFDENLVYINYYQDYKVTNLHITDNDDKTILFKPKNISKYLKRLTSNDDQLKPIIINENKPNYNNIINKIKINNNSNSKINKNNTNKTIKKNIDFIKELQKRSNSRERSQSKDKTKNKTNIKDNSINIKANKPSIKPNNNKNRVNKK